MTDVTQARKPGNQTEKNQKADEAIGKIVDEVRYFKALQKPDFSFNKEFGATVVEGEADSALFLGQDERYGTSLQVEQGAGDFSNKIVLAVGFLNEGKSDGSLVDLTDPNLRYGAGLTIYQRTDTGKDLAFEKEGQSDSEKERNKERKATTATPQKAVSVFEINGDVIELKARNGGVNIIAGIDPTRPSYGDKQDKDKANVNYVGVSLIGGGNPGTDILNDEENIRGLQPMVKGISLENRLSEVIDRIGDVTKVVNKMLKSQKVLETALAFHVHTDPVSVLTGPSIDLATAIGAVKTPLDILNVLRVITARYNELAVQLNSSSISEGSFTSKFNKTN